MTKPGKIHKKRKKRKGLSSENKRLFLYHDDLTMECESYITSNFSSPSKPLYRWTKAPITQRDFVPQYYLGIVKEETLDIDLTTEELVERITVSMHTSEEASISAYKGILTKLEKKDEKELNDPAFGHKAQFTSRCGGHVSKFNLTEDDALVGEENNKGHVNVIFKKDFDFERCLDETFGTKKILEDEI